MAMLPHQMCESEALKKFFVMYFVAHDIMGRTGAEDSSEMGQEDHSWLEDDDLEEVCLFCLHRQDNNLIDIVSNFSSIYITL